MTTNPRLNPTHQSRGLKRKKEDNEEYQFGSSKRLIVLRGFPGSGKSTLCKAIRDYYHSQKVQTVAHNNDDYHWSGGREGKGVFKFNYNPHFHQNTKMLCKKEIAESITRGIPIVIIDNANFEKWNYGKSIQHAMKHEYAITVIEINSESPNHSRVDHLKHLHEEYVVDDCMLCQFQVRCKMQVPRRVMEKFLMKYQVDPNVIIVAPKLKENEVWTMGELRALLSIQRDLDFKEYDDDEWQQSNHKKTKIGYKMNGHAQNAKMQRRHKMNANNHHNHSHRSNGYGHSQRSDAFNDYNPRFKSISFVTTTSNVDRIGAEVEQRFRQHDDYEHRDRDRDRDRDRRRRPRDSRYSGSSFGSGNSRNHRDRTQRRYREEDMDIKYDDYGHEVYHNEESRSREYEQTDRQKYNDRMDRSSRRGSSRRSPKRQRQRGNGRGRSDRRGNGRGRGRNSGRGRGRKSHRGGYDNPFVQADSSAVLDEIRSVNDELSWRRRR